jgi:hypothetical protein
MPRRVQQPLVLAGVSSSTPAASSSSSSSNSPPVNDADEVVETSSSQRRRSAKWTWKERYEVLRGVDKHGTCWEQVLHHVKDIEHLRTTDTPEQMQNCFKSLSTTNSLLSRPFKGRKFKLTTEQRKETPAAKALLERVFMAEEQGI